MLAINQSEDNPLLDDEYNLQLRESISEVLHVNVQWHSRILSLKRSEIMMVGVEDGFNVRDARIVEMKKLGG